MVRSPSTYILAAMLCAGLLFSCTPDIEVPPPPNEQNSSSGTEQPLSQSNDNPSSSSTQAPTSSPAQSSSSAPKGSSSNSIQKSSSSLAGCTESNPKSGFTCAWDKTGILVPGVSLKPTYSGQDNCSIAWKYKDDSSPLADCLQTTQNGLTTKGNSTYFLWAELTCPDGKHVNACDPKTGLYSRIAPSLTGTCAWNKNPTTTARGAVPSGVSISDPDNICGGTKSVVYKYDGGTKTWPTDGTVEEGTYNVQATATCPAYDVAPVTCPTLEVKGGADYEIECNGSYECEVNLRADECVKISFHSSYPLEMYCGAEGSSNISFTLSNNGTTARATGSYHTATTIQLRSGTNPSTLCLTAISGATIVECSGWLLLD